MTNRSVEFVVQAGRTLLEAGAEVYRVEDTVQKMGDALGIQLLESYVTPAGVFISYIDSAGSPGTFFRKAAKRGVNLSKISAINNLSRQVAQKEVELDEAFTILGQIESAGPTYSTLIKISCGAVNAAAITVINGGSWQDFWIAFMVTHLVYLLIDATRILSIPFLRELLIGSVGTALVLATRTVIDFDINTVIVGVLLSAIPGAFMVNSVRDVIAGDLISGAIRGFEAVGLMVALFGGAGITIGIVGLEYLPQPVEPVTPIIALGFFVSALFNIYNQAPKRTVLGAGSVGLLSSFVLYWTMQSPFSIILGMLWGAMAASIASEILARIYRVPVTVFIIGGFVPLLPGVWFFRATQFLFTGNYPLFFEPLLMGVTGIMAVGVGVAVVTAIVRHWKRKHQDILLDERFFRRKHKGSRQAKM
ncbi:threonine/serine exporter family protein [Heliobacterium chlorum]|uniref:Threonine/serine exporter family protein n=1 Tax=Heliobacterium chlorum TaxID=2698 RepID=A0ABR7T3B0_HELCL|nr:threonine/serine exporter family protein [Heliobacterium chlorum]MBC9785131.1 threonine/serine exporter family protein [Heliobacterium chlorum]